MTLRPRPEQVAAAAAVAVLALGATACSGSDDSSSDTNSSSTGGTSSGGELTEANFKSTITDSQFTARTSHVSMKDRRVRPDHHGRR